MLGMGIRYQKWCREHKYSFEASYNNIGGFLLSYVLNNKGSTRSVSLVLGLLKRFFKIEGLNWLTESESYKVQLLISELKFRDYSSPIQKKPLSMLHLLSIMNKVNLNNNITLYGVTLIFMGHDGLMRSGELFSKLVVEDILWDPNKTSFQLSLKRSKTHRSGSAKFISFVDRNGWSAVKLLKLYFDRFKLWCSYGTVLFPKVTKNKIRNWSTFGKVEWFRKFIKKMAFMIGLNPKLYSGHSLRAGGATDLFVAKVPYPIIKKAGRWKSDAALLYYRDEEDVAQGRLFQHIQVLKAIVD
jgi:hypothetical protein